MDGSVIVPLFVYPSVGAWNPVYNMASLYPRLQFTAVLNIHNGPGEGALPSEEYSQGIGMLNSLNNVRTIGYVATTWCTRSLSSVLDDIAAYSFWGEYNSSLAVKGISSTKPQHSTVQTIFHILETISQAIRQSPGLKDDYIVHNPGALPEPQYFERAASDIADLTIMFENFFANWIDEGNELTTATQAYDHAKLGLLVHSVPDLATSELETALQQLLAVGHSVWLTGTEDYAGFDALFPEFIDCLAALLDKMG